MRRRRAPRPQAAEGGVLVAEPLIEQIQPTVRCGFYFEDKWISPYLRVDFVLPPGSSTLDFEVYNPQHEEFRDAWFLVRLGLTPLYRSEPMPTWHRQVHSIELPALDEGGVASVAFRSSVRWRAPHPDERVLGLILLSLVCTVRN